MWAEIVASAPHTEEAGNAETSCGARTVVCHHDVERLKRQLDMLREVSARAANARSGEEALRQAPELHARLAQVLRCLAVYHATLQRELTPSVEGEGRYRCLMRQHLVRCGERQCAEIAELSLAAQLGRRAQDVARRSWAAAVAMRVDVESLDANMAAIIGLLRTSPRG